MHQGCVLGNLLFLLCTSERFSILENKLIGYAYATTLIAVVHSPGIMVTVAESVNCDLGTVNGLCYCNHDAWLLHPRLVCGVTFNR